MSINVVVIDDVYGEVEPLIQALQKDEKFTLRYSAWENEAEAEAVRALVRREPYSVVLLDLFFRGDEKGEEIFKLLKSESENAQIIILTAQGERGIFKKYKALGAYDYEIKASTPAHIQNCINKIEMAGEEGGSYAAEFEKIDRLYSSEPSHALHQFEALFKKGFNNLSCSKQYASRLKSYFGGTPFSYQQSRIPLTPLLEMMLNNCLRIEAADPSDVDNLMDLAVTHLHRSEESKAEDVFRRLIYGSDPIPTSIIRGIFSWLAEIHYAQTSSPPSADWLRSRLILAGDQQQYQYFIQALGQYDRELWQAAVREWLGVLEDLWSSGEKRRAADLLIWLVAEYGAKEILSIFTTNDKSAKERFLRFCEAAAREGANPDEQGVHGLLALLELIFKEKDLSLLSEDEKKSCYDILEQAYLDCLTAEEHGEDVAARLYELMTGLQFSNSDMLLKVLGNVKGQRPDLWLKYLRSGINHLNAAGRHEDIHHLVSTCKIELINRLRPEELVELGNILDEAKSPISNELYQEAIGKYLVSADAAKSVDDLFEPKRLILLLEERGRSLEVNTLKEQLKQKIARLSKPIRMLDGERIAILGGHPSNEERFKTLLQDTMGGTYTWYDGFKDSDGQSLVKALKQRRYSVVIHITGQCAHDTFVPVHNEVVRLNNESNGSVREIIIPKKHTGPEGVANIVKDYFAGGSNDPANS